MYVHVCMPVCLHVSKGVLKVQENVRVPGAGLTAGYDLPKVDAGKKLQVLCESSSSSNSLGHLSRPKYLWVLLTNLHFFWKYNPQVTL